MKLRPKIPLRANELINRALDTLFPYPNNPRHHSDNQIESLIKSIKAFGQTRPLIIDEQGTILCGNGCFEALKRMGATHASVLIVRGLSDTKKRALVIADNRLAEKSEWSVDDLKIHFEELIKVNFDVELTGFSMGAIDLMLGEPLNQEQSEDAEETLCIDAGTPAVSVLGDRWNLGPHKLICGDSREHETFEQLLARERAETVITDAPFNVRVRGHERGRSKKAHREFAMASGEMSRNEFIAFLEMVMRRAIQFSADGSVH